MLSECPHCLCRVIPTDDRCPNCQGNVREKAERVGIFVESKTVFPERCHYCNIRTTSRKKIVARDVSDHWHEGMSSSDASSINSCLLWPVKVLVGIVFGVFSIFINVLIRAALNESTNDTSGWVRLHHKIVVKIPTCENCKRQDIKPVKTLGKEGKIKIAVHRDFAQSVGHASDQVQS